MLVNATMKANYTPSIEGKAQELCKKLHLAAKSSDTRRFHALYDKVYQEDFVEQAWERVKRNKGGPGIDGEEIADIVEEGEKVVLSEIQETLREGEYYPKKVKRVYIPKPDGRRRPLGIPTIRDRVVQTAAKEVLEPIFEADFLECSYGFRPNRSTHDANEKVRKTMNAGYTIVLDADIKGFFDNVDHAKLLEFVRQRISDRRILKLIRKWLKSGVMDSGIARETEEGTPQGGVISPLLANIYLHEFDKFWEEQTRVDGELVRYADDMVLMFKLEEEADLGKRLVEAKLEELKLELNQKKTSMVETRGKEEGFDFLGFYFWMSESEKDGRYYSYRRPSKKARQNFKNRIKSFFEDRSKLQWTLDQVVEKLNLYIRGWMNYFKYGNSSEIFKQLDHYVHEKLAIWQSNKQQMTGGRWTRDFGWKEFKESGIQILQGNIEYWSTYSKAQE